MLSLESQALECWHEIRGPLQPVEQAVGSSDCSLLPSETTAEGGIDSVVPSEFFHSPASPFPAFCAPGTSELPHDFEGRVQCDAAPSHLLFWHVSFAMSAIRSGHLFELSGHTSEASWSWELVVLGPTTSASLQASSLPA